MTHAKPKAVVLLSGGVDSSTVLAIARDDGFDVIALSFDYGQRHKVELEAAKRVAAAFGVNDHRIVAIDMRAIGGSALTDDIDVPKCGTLTPSPSPQGRGGSEGRADGSGDSIPVTYVPARNTIFLSVALGVAEACGAREIFIGVNAIDYSGYPDCRPAFIEAFERLANLATKAGAEGEKFRINAPLLHMTKKEIIERGRQLGLDYALTMSCYDPRKVGDRAIACGACDSCRLRADGFRAAGLDDPGLRAKENPR